jgi:elongation factor Ts
VSSMQITREAIKKLRDKTGAGMMDCKKALEQTAGDLDAAVEYLRKKGAAVVQKRADRTAKEGAIVTRVQHDGKLGVVVEVNCETDFVARSSDFVAFVQDVAEAIERHRPKAREEILTLTAKDGKKISEHLNDLLSKVGEKVEIRRFLMIESPDGQISSYTHLGSKIGVLVELSSTAAGTQAGRDVAMQIAAMNPMVVSRDQLDKVVIDREMDIYRTQASNEGKSPQIVEKVAAGRLEKFYQEVCLLDQTFIKDAGKTVRDYLGEVTGSPGTPIVVKRFTRFHLGEESA